MHQRRAYDMAGNTFEWVNDRYDAYYYPNGPDIDPPGPASGTRRVVRGSNFSSKNADIPVSLRFLAPPDDHRSDLGFRCVVEQPRVFAPYCQTSAFVTGDANVPPPSRSCDVSQHEVGSGCRFVNHDIEAAGEIRFVEEEPPLVCGIAGAPNRISCSSPDPNTTAGVLVAVTCGTVNLEDLPADPECLEDYEVVPGSEVSCEMIPGSSGPTGCRDGEVLVDMGDGTTACERLLLVEEEIEVEEREVFDPVTGCLPGMDPAPGSDGTSICSVTLPGGRTIECPPGTIPRPTSPDSYACFEPGSGTRIEVPCTPGRYRTEDGMCAGTIPEGGSEPANSCIEGFTYDTALGCCQSPSGVYPSCGADEYYDTVHGCQPRPDASGGILTLITFSVTTGGGCGGGVPGGDDPGDDDPGGSPCDGITESATCAAIAGCHFDGVLKVCVPD